MDIHILHIMKYFIAIFTFALCAHCCAQFIPQPMGYNPDENSDGLIGVGDLQGLLALYGNAFDNGDSLTVVSTPDNLWQDGLGTFVIPNGTDIVYLNYEVPVAWTSAAIELPETTGFSTLMVFTDPILWKNHFLSFYYQGDNQETHRYNRNRSKCFVWIHGHNGKWYLVSGPTYE